MNEQHKTKIKQLFVELNEIRARLLDIEHAEWEAMRTSPESYQDDDNATISLGECIERLEEAIPYLEL